MISRDMATSEEWRMSDSEVHYLYWYIQGGIMEPQTRWRLRWAWGFCERHAWGAFAVEAAFRHGYLHGPALLYGDLLERAGRAFAKRGPWSARRVAWNLRARKPCMLCQMGYSYVSRGHGAAREEVIARGSDIGELRAFADSTKEYWRPTVCGRCAGDGSRPRCRPHLLEDVAHGAAIDLAEQRAFVDYLVKHLTAYYQSFVWGYHGTDTVEDRAALVSAVGWCSGWRTGLPIIGAA